MKFKKGDFVEIIATKHKESRNLIGKRALVANVLKAPIGGNMVLLPFESPRGVCKDSGHCWVAEENVKKVDLDKDIEFQDFMCGIDLVGYNAAPFLEEGELEMIVKNYSRR